MDTKSVANVIGEGIAITKTNTLKRLLEFPIIEARQAYYIVQSDYPRDCIEAVKSLSHCGIDGAVIEKWLRIYLQEL